MPKPQRTHQHLLSIFLLLLTLASSALAQSSDLSFTPHLDLNQLLADRLVLLAQQALAGRSAPRPDQLTRAHILLDEALGINPGDAEGWRLSVELADQIHDPVAALAALKKYCELRPSDDAAQWSLIQRTLAQRQTIQQRLAALENLLDGSVADSLSPPLRSRIAATAAQWAHEIGDLPRFGRRLTQALQLDPANPQAAKLLYDFAASRHASPMELGVTLLAYVKSAPLDSLARWQLGDLFLSQGAYDAATQQLVAAKAVATRPLAPENAPAFYGDLIISLAASGHTPDALNLLSQLDIAWNPKPASQPASATSPTPGTADPDAPATSDAASTPEASTTPSSQSAIRNSESEIHLLPLNLELLRLAILRKGPRVDALVAALRTQLASVPPVQSGDADIQMARLILLFGGDLNAAADALTAAAKPLAPDNPEIQALRGWLALRRGQTDQARTLLKPLADQNALAAYGMARSYPSPNDPDRLVWLVHAVDLAPAQLPGFMAAMDILALGARADPTPIGAALSEKLTQWPRIIAFPDPSQQIWVMPTIKVDLQRFAYLEPIHVKLTLRNATEVPLALSEGSIGFTGAEDLEGFEGSGAGTIPTRLFLITSTTRGQANPMDLPPRVIDMARRLSLGPQESIDLDVRLDRGQLSLLLDATPNDLVSMTVLAMLDAYPTAKGGFTPGPLGGTDVVRSIERQGLPVTHENLTLWTAALAPGADVTEKARALAILAQIACANDANSDAQGAATRAATALDDAFPRLDPLAQAWVVSFLAPPSASASPALAALRDAADRIADPTVRLVFLTTQVVDPQAPALNATLRTDNPTLVEYAKAVRLGLEAAKAAPQPQSDQTESPTAPATP